MRANDAAIIRYLLRVTDARPSEVQKRDFQGLPVSIEVTAGGLRELRNDAGRVIYSRILPHAYGFIDGTKGRDGDEIDCIIGPWTDSKAVWIVQMQDLGADIDERQNEDKCFLGFSSFDEMHRSFCEIYNLSFWGGCRELTMRQFRPWLRERSR